MTRVAILDDYLLGAMDLADWSRLPAEVTLSVFSRPFADQAEAARQLAGFEVIVAMRERTRFGAELLAALNELRLLITTGMRNLAIDLKFCEQHNILVCGTRSATRPVASTVELAWAHILSLSKGLVRADQDLRSGLWQTPWPAPSVVKP